MNGNSKLLIGIYGTLMLLCWGPFVYLVTTTIKLYVIDGVIYGLPAGFSFLFGFGTAVFLWLLRAEVGHRRAQKLYLHGGKSILVK